jgi:hypothetical protein
MNDIVATLRNREPVAPALPQALLLAAYALVYLLSWSLVPLATHWEVPGDNLEQLA